MNMVSCQEAVASWQLVAHELSLGERKDSTNRSFLEPEALADCGTDIGLRLRLNGSLQSADRLTALNRSKISFHYLPLHLN